MKAVRTALPATVVPATTERRTEHKSEHKSENKIYAGHRHSLPGQHEHDFEPQYGLPEVLPDDEQLLWQGSPDWQQLAVRRFHVRKLVIYFSVLLAARIGSQMSEGLTLGSAIGGSLTMLALSVIAIGLVTLMAWLSARSTVYTLTDKRVVMRIGIVLTLSLNLPLRRFEGAALQAHRGSAQATGDIAIRLLASERVAYLHLWPHARAWQFARPEPTLLCVPDAARVAKRLTEAFAAATGQPARAAAEAKDRPAERAPHAERAPSLVAR